MNRSRKITDLIQTNSAQISLEVTPDIKDEEIELCTFPLFTSVTWHSKTHQCLDLDIPPLRLARRLKSIGQTVLLHLSCDQLRIQYLEQLFKFLQDNEIYNLFVVLGELFNPSGSDFLSTKDLIAYIRDKTGNFFCIGIAASPGKDVRWSLLKEKIDSGADFIITQAVFEYEVYENFVKKCKELKITVPIITGMFLFETLQELKYFTNLCKVKISDSVLEKISSMNGDEIPGWKFVKVLMNNIIDNRTEGAGANIHFFTMNKVNNVHKFLLYFAESKKNK